MDLNSLRFFRLCGSFLNRRSFVSRFSRFSRSRLRSFVSNLGFRSFNRLFLLGSRLFSRHRRLYGLSDTEADTLSVLIDLQDLSLHDLAYFQLVVYVADPLMSDF